MGIELPQGKGKEKKEFELKNKVFIYKAEGRRDPFVPLIGKEIVKPPPLPERGREERMVSPFRLTGLIWNKKGAWAIIQERNNGEVWLVREGGEIKGYKISRITTESITFVSEEEVFTLRIGEELATYHKKREKLREEPSREILPEERFPGGFPLGVGPGRGR